METLESVEIKQEKEDKHWHKTMSSMGCLVTQEQAPFWRAMGSESESGDVAGSVCWEDEESAQEVSAVDIWNTQVSWCKGAEASGGKGTWEDTGTKEEGKELGVRKGIEDGEDNSNR